jgi:cytochrome c-type biogenesis protein CcmH/NrfG
MTSRALLLAVALSAVAAPAVAAGPTAAELKRGAAQCLARRSEDACDDAVRWNPSDPALLVALADLELRAQHPADALRHYHRAAEIAPSMNGLNAKIAAADAQLHPKHRAVAARPAQATTKPTAQTRQFSNTESPSESH